MILGDIPERRRGRASWCRLLLMLIGSGLFIFLIALTAEADEKGAQGQPEAHPCMVPRAVEGGRIAGYTEDDGLTCRYLGIPYAAPPVDAGRWRPPSSPLPWEGVKQATKAGPRCYQKGSMKLVNGHPFAGVSEDCLSLNVFVPNGSGPFPVLVFFHGGGYLGGTSSTPMYEGDELAAKGKIVVVTVNYRLGIFGFLATPGLQAEDAHGSAGNYGLLDQIQALAWVKQNIANLEGDPERVTIAGESAGGWSVSTLLSSPLAKGLFHRAIMESGGAHAVSSMERGLEIGRRVSQEFGCAVTDPGCLREVSATKLLFRGALPEAAGFEWQPRVDGYVLNGVPQAAFEAGYYSKVPFLAGFNRDEVRTAALLHPRSFLEGWKHLRKRLANDFGPDAVDALMKLYPDTEYRRPILAYQQILTDAVLACPTLNAFLEVAKQQDEAWLYRFDYDDYFIGHQFGAFHGTELPFVFGTLERWPASVFFNRRSARRATPLSEQMMTWWSSFVRTGIPESPDISSWPPFGRDAQLKVMDQPTRLETLSEQTRARCEFWRSYTVNHPWISETGGFLGKRPGKTRGIQPPAPQYFATPSRSPSPADQGEQTPLE